VVSEAQLRHLCERYLNNSLDAKFAHGYFCHVPADKSTYGKRCFFRLVSASLLCSATIVCGQPIRFENASATYPLTKRIIDDFDHADGSVRVVVGKSGSALALQRLCNREVEFATAARPIIKSEVAQCLAAGITFVELPLALDGIAVVANPQNAFISTLSIEELRTVWASEAQGKLTRWSQLGAQYPDVPLNLYGMDGRAERGNYFNEAILGPGRETRRDFTASADDNIIVQAVARDPRALGYVPFGYYANNRRGLKAIAITRAPGDSPAYPSLESIASGQYHPLTRPLFLYVTATSLERQEVASLAGHYLDEARRLARELNYVPLSDDTYRAARNRLRERTAGSYWDGSVPVGATLDLVRGRRPGP